MGRGASLVRGLYAQLERLEWLIRLVVRVSVGIEFFGSGLGKLGKLPGFIQYFRSLGIPFPELQAPFVAGVELTCGTLILLGLFTRPAALMLCGVMSVAIVTAAVPERKIGASWHGLLEFFYLPEWGLLLLLAWLVIAGPGRASLDALISRRSSGVNDTAQSGGER
jgi:putative oxidoreductase